MKKLTFFIVLLCIIQMASFSQSCLQNGITFTTQAQIDNYPDNFTINKTQDIKKQKLKGVRPSNEEKYQQYLKYKKFVDDIEKKYTKQIYDLLLLNKPFSMDKIIQLVENPPQVNTTVFEVFEAWIKELYK